MVPKKKLILLIIIVIIVSLISYVFIFRKQSTYIVTNKSKEITNIRRLPWEGETQLHIDHIVGNIIVKQWNEKVIKIKSTKINDDSTIESNSNLYSKLDYTITKSMRTLSLQSTRLPDLNYYPVQLDITIFIPNEIKSVRIKNQIGNIQVEGVKIENLNLVTEVGNIGTDFKQYTKEIFKNIPASYTYRTDWGNIFVVLPVASSVDIPQENTFLLNLKKEKDGIKFNLYSGTFGHNYLYGISNKLGSQTKVLTSDQMQTDTNLVITTLKTFHPELINGYSSYQKEVIDNIYKEITEPQNIESFYFLLNSLVTTLNDGHTELQFFSSDFIDLPLIWLEDGLFIKSAVGLLEKGDKILEIGGLSESDLLEKLKVLISAENIYRIKSEGAIRLANGLYLRHLGLINKDNEVEIKVERNGKEIAVELPLIDNPLKYKNMFDQNPRKWVWWNTNRSNNIAIFHFNNFAENKYINNNLYDFFENVNNSRISNIVLDIRDNQGGSEPYIYKILEYINIDKYTGYSTNNQTKYIKNKKSDQINLQFCGKLYILTSSQSFSSATALALIAKDNAIATIIGEPTGNASTMYGNSKYKQLSQAHFILKFATIVGKRPNEKIDPVNIIKPDIYLNFTRKDIILGDEHYFYKLCRLLN